MLSIRLSRVGKKKQPSYRLIVTEKSRDPWGKHLEILGSYNPRTEPNSIQLKEDRVKYWLEKGAQPSPTVHNLLVDAGIIKGEKVKATSPKKKESADTADKGKAESTPSEAKETPTSAEEKPAENESSPAEETNKNAGDKTEDKKEEAPSSEENKKES